MHRRWKNTASVSLFMGGEDTAVRSISILGVRVDVLTWEMFDACVAEFVAGGTPHQAVTVNPEFIMAAQRNAAFRRVLNQADLALADGWGVQAAARLLGQRLPVRVTGADGVPRLAALAAARGWRLYLLGAAPGVAVRAAQTLQARHPALHVVGTYAGSPHPADEDAIVEQITAAQPDILFVAYGAPAQDLWIARNQDRLHIPFAMGVGGALDFVAGVRRRAPRWVQRAHLEWLYRLLQEPWRWRRQLALPRFAAAVLGQAWREWQQGR